MSELIVSSRRGFLSGLIGGLICAPAIVRASNLMPIKSLVEEKFSLAPLGLREDLEDVIYRVTPYETPFVNWVKPQFARQFYYEWQTETLVTQ